MAMTPDNERGDLPPMLSHRSEDNAQGDLSPMISGRSTKIIVDARGAYLSGNIEALIEQLNERQQHEFRLAMIALACSYAAQAFRLVADNALEHEHLERVRQWLRAPTPDPDGTLLAQLLQDYIVFDHRRLGANPINGYSSESPAGDVLLRLALALCSPTLAEVVTHSTEAVILACWMEFEGARPYYWHFRWISPRYRRQFKWTALRYQLESAWALIRGQKPLALEDYLSEARQGDYRTADLNLLVSRMDKTRRLRFRQLVVHQGLQAIYRYMPWVREYPAEWACLDAIREWAADPTEVCASVAVQRVKGLPYSLDPRTREIHSKVGALVDGIRANSELRAATLALEPFVPHINQTEGHDFEWPDPLDTVQWWQIQAAWSLLHGEEPPRLWSDPGEASP